MKHTMSINHLVHRWSQALLALVLLVGSASFPIAPFSPSEPAKPTAAEQPARADSQAAAHGLAPMRPELHQSSQSISAGDEVESFSSGSPTPDLQRSDANPLNSAYVSDVDLGDGRRQAIVSSSPINYQAKDGSWQPIDSRFQAVEGGFVNRTNLLQVSAGERRAALRVQSGDSLVGWEPQAVRLTAAAGGEIVLAEPLDAAESLAGALAEGGRVIRYSQSWTMPGLSEEIVSGPGQVEQSLIFAQRPDPHPTLPLQEGGQGGGEGEFLALRAALRLPSGASLYVEGEKQTDAFTTTGYVEIRDAAGQTALALAAPRAFEQADPNVGVAGSYRLTPQGEGQWQVEVRTPWAWWADPERAYPAVLDPTMYIVQPTIVRDVYSEDPICRYHTDPLDLGFAPKPYALGRHPECNGGIFRLLLRFSQFPSLPPGYEIEKAELVAAPVSGYYHSLGTVRLPATAEVGINRVTSDWWSQPGPVLWNSYQVAEQVGEAQSLMATPPEYRTAGFSVARFTLQEGNSGLVSRWLQGVDNYGLELHLTKEAQGTEFVIFPDPPGWSSEDKDTLPDYFLFADGGGFMLWITYRAPTLQDGVTFGFNNQPDLPSYDPANFSFSDHHYALPASSSAWSAVALKGIDAIIDPGDTLYRAAGNPRLERGDVKSEGSFDGASNYLAIRGDPQWQDPEVEVLPFGSASTSPDFYVLEARSATPFAGGQQFLPNTMDTGTFTMSTFELLRVFDLNLSQDTRVEITATSSLYDVGVQAYQPQSWLGAFPKDSLVAVTQAPIEFLVESGSEGVWGVILDYPGNPNGLEDPYNTTMTVTVGVMACALNAMPVPGEGCWEPSQPTSSTPCQQVGPYAVYDEENFGYDNGIYVNNGKGVLVRYGSCADANVGQRLTAITGKVSIKNEVEPYELWGYDSKVYLRYWFDPGNSNDAMTQLLWDDGFEGHPDVADLDYLYLTPHPFSKIKLPLADADQNQASFRVYVPEQYAEGRATIVRQVETQAETHPGLLEAFTFELTWRVYAEGYPDSPDSEPVTLQSGTGQAEVGSMDLIFDAGGWSMDYQPGIPGEPGRFGDLRNHAKIAHSPELGGAWKPVQVVILPANISLPGNNAFPCNGSCLDVRSPSGDYRQWEMPDITLSGQANTIVFSRPGQLDVFSNDQPNDLNDVPMPFDFRVFDATATTHRGICPGSANQSEVTIIHGQGYMALPGLGSTTNTNMMIGVTFDLCEDELRGASFSFNGVPIPVGSTGLFITGLHGGFQALGADDMRIEVSVDYAAGAEGGLTSGTAMVAIDTRGLFDVQVQHGQLVALLNYSGRAWVSWNPLDVGVDILGQMDLWLISAVVQVQGHMWQGRGWQGQYWWLPDNSDMHATASLVAEIVIPEGEILSVWWLPDIPPDDWHLFSIRLAFGEFFCGGCAKGYEWGIKGAVSHAIFTLGYDVGLYVGFESGLDIILGSDGHKLIDQTPGLSQAASRDDILVAGRPLDLPRSAAIGSLAQEYTIPLTITAYADSALIGLGWENLNGSPQLTLIRPGGLEISPTNAAQYGVALTETVFARLYVIQSPISGVWQAKISNSASQDNWHLLFFANKRAPEFDLLTPATPGQPWSADEYLEYPLQWSVPSDLDPDLELGINLYYTLTVSQEPTPTTGVIIQGYNFAAGQYDWDMAYLSAGTYQVYATLSPTGTGAYQPRPTVTGTNQVLGVDPVVAPGSIALTDTIAPATPTGLNLTPLDEAFRACWTPNPEPDIAGYVVTYIVNNLHGVEEPRTLWIPASVPFSSLPGAPQECVRLGGLNAGYNTGVILAAYDASGNQGLYSAPVGGTVEHAPDEGPYAGSNLSGQVGPNHSVNLSWSGVTGAVYWLYYAADTPAGPHQAATGATEGPSPIYAGAATALTVNGLPVGRKVHFVLQAYDVQGRPGALSNHLSLWLTDGADSNGDGLPDDVADAYDLDSPDDDPDKDCLINLEEYLHPEYLYSTNPRRPDTDQDGYTDGEEVRGGSSPLDPQDRPEDLEPLPKLFLGADHLLFRAGTEGGSPPSQSIEILNRGGGVLTPAVASDTPWLQVQLVGNQLQVSVNAAGLSHGHYSGEITVSGAAGGCTTNSPQTIRVDLGVFEGLLLPSLDYQIYLPTVARNLTLKLGISQSTRFKKGDVR